MFNLLPKDTVFFDLFENIAARVVASAGYLHKLAREFPKIDGWLQLIRKEEHEADDLCHAALDRLSPFSVPILLEIGKERSPGHAGETMILREAEEDLIAEALS